jgi:hypothetical protein
VVKTFDSLMKRGENIDILIPENIRRIATKFFSYVSVKDDILMAGG